MKFIGIVFCIFMGITAISLGFGALYPPINLIAKPLVCPEGRLEYEQNVSNPLPGRTYVQVKWYCSAGTTEMKTRISNVLVHLIAGTMQGLLLYLFFKLILRIRRNGKIDAK